MQNPVPARLFSLIVLLCGPGAAGASEGHGNLQVLPLHLSRAEVLEVMRLITVGLGTQCTLCHRSEHNDYHSDELEQKQVARAMMRMVQANTPGLDWARPPAKLCSTCHDGSLTVPDSVRQGMGMQDGPPRSPAE